MHRLWSIVGLVAATGVVLGITTFGGYSQADQNSLREVKSFSTIENETARSVALYQEAFKVISHSRCMNCHPRDDSPRQGDAQTMHQPRVVRGPNDFGAPGMQCTTCHGPSNVAYVTGDGSIPGHDPWHLAPKSMGWMGMTSKAICEQLKDPARNGNRDLAAIHDHMANDGLVGWAWKPGAGRTPAPGTQDTFGKLIKAWIDTGAVCPAT